MKAIVIILSLFTGFSNFTFATGFKDIDPFAYYNLHKHSDKEHSGMIAFEYKMYFNLTKKEYNYLTRSIISIFEENKALLESKPDVERQEMEVTLIHNMLVKAFESMAPCDRYN